MSKLRFLFALLALGICGSRMVSSGGPIQRTHREV
jgi:hypothetical protein